MAAYIRGVDMVTGSFSGYQVDHVDRRKNEAADALSRLGSRREPVPRNVFLDELWTPSVKILEEAAYTDDPDSELVAVTWVIQEWTEPYLAYLMKGELPQ